MCLPIFGLFSEIFPVYARKPLFGYKVVVVSSLLITILSAVVWVHHMFASGTPSWMRMLFMFTTMAISIPTGMKVFAWVATVWGGKLRLDTAHAVCPGRPVMFLFAGITGIMLSSVPFDIHVNNTYFVVGHFHYVINGAVVMGVYAAIYHWFPKMTGRMYYEGLGKLHFALTFIGVNLNFLPMHPLGLMGMPRRVASYDPEFAFWNVIASLGGFLLGVSTLPFTLEHDEFLDAGQSGAGDNPWRGDRSGVAGSFAAAASKTLKRFRLWCLAAYGYGSHEPLVSNNPAGRACEGALWQSLLKGESHEQHQHRSYTQYQQSLVRSIESEEDHRMFGFIVFLLSESVIFFSFFVGYIVYKTNMRRLAPCWV